MSSKENKTPQLSNSLSAPALFTRQNSWEKIPQRPFVGVATAPLPTVPNPNPNTKLAPSLIK